MLLPMTDPITEIAAERERAGAASDPLVDVCFLATADAGGQPSLRALSLRHVEPTGVGILISGHSPKAADLDATGRCELLILWKSIARQYRLRGRLEPMSDERRAEYWALKAHSSKLLEHYYEEVAPQSTPLADRPGFLGAIEALRSRHADPAAVPIPAGLRALVLVPERVDVWHGHPERLHERWLYTRGEGSWDRTLLVP
jgi:pyridoxamine 5'-phosphate oxidase